MEVDRWVQFSRHFEHAGGSEPRTPDFLAHLYASLFAPACNFGLYEFAPIAELSYDRLAWCTNWYIREETQRSAITSIVNQHHRLPLSQLWGGGTLSSSDGQRFPVSVRSKRAAALPRYFGYGRGLTFYSTVHRPNVEELRRLLARDDFVYVADSKLWSTRNLAYIDPAGGKFVTVLPRTRREDQDFRDELRQQGVR